MCEGASSERRESWGSFGTGQGAGLHRRSRFHYVRKLTSLFLVFWPPALILFCPFACLQPSHRIMLRDPGRSPEGVFKIKAPSATRRWLKLSAAPVRMSDLFVRVASGRAHWQKTAPSWGFSGGFVDGLLVSMWERRDGPESWSSPAIALSTTFASSLRCSWFSRALLGRSEPNEARRRQLVLVVGFRSPRADPRGVKTSRCVKSVRMPRGSDDASSLVL